MTKALVIVGQSTAYSYKSLKRALKHYAELKAKGIPAALVSVTDHCYYIRSTQMRDVAQRYDFNEVSQLMAGLFNHD